MGGTLLLQENLHPSPRAEALGHPNRYLYVNPDDGSHMSVDANGNVSADNEDDANNWFIWKDGLDYAIVHPHKSPVDVGKWFPVFKSFEPMLRADKKLVEA